MVLKTVDAWVLIQRRYIRTFDVDLELTRINRKIKQMCDESESEEKILNCINVEYKKLRNLYKKQEEEK